MQIGLSYDFSLPHGPSMRLIEEVDRFDAHEVVIGISDYQRLDHPLRHGGRLGIACVVEYAAQGAAVHGVLCGRTVTKAYVVAVHDLAWDCGYFPPSGDRLRLICREKGRAGGGVRYGFGLYSKDTELASGQVTLAFVGSAGPL